MSCPSGFVNLLGTGFAIESISDLVFLPSASHTILLHTANDCLLYALL